MIRFLTAGESHGQTLVMTLDGMPAGLELDIDALNAQLRRRQGGYGRGRRMQIESDRAEVLAGVRHGRTTGAPIGLLIRNRDWVNWQQTMHVEREMPDGATGTKRADATRPAASRDSCSDDSASGSPVTSRPSATWCCRTIAPCRLTRHRRFQKMRR